MLGKHLLKRRVTIAVAALTILLLATRLRHQHPAVPRWAIEKNPGDTDNPPCLRLPGRDDVVFVMRTGATEIQDKLPAHLNTTFRCYDDLIIFSDYEETFEGLQVHDVLASMNEDLMETNMDFKLYKRLKQYGRANLTEEELSGKASFEGSKSGKKDNPGWRLDKWKCLPMMSEVLKLRPDKKWYVFIESDSYPVYSNIIQWLQTLDPSKPWYYGSEVQIGPDVFAHGGSVFVMSKSAIEIGAQYYADHEDELNEWTDSHWAGDCVLGKMLRDAGVPLQWSFPMFQGGHPEKMDFTEHKMGSKLWCSPALSYHHFAPADLAGMWQFEQAWIQSRLDQAMEKKRWTFRNDYSDILEHRDVFKLLVLPQIRESRSEDWNNFSPTFVGETEGSSFEECEKLCEAHPSCLQFVSGSSGCSISYAQVSLGQAWGDMKSGWFLDRIERWIRNLNHCGGKEGWIKS